jgi:hypothetical protein
MRVICLACLTLFDLLDLILFSSDLYYQMLSIYILPLETDSMLLVRVKQQVTII